MPKTFVLSHPEELRKHFRANDSHSKYELARIIAMLHVYGTTNGRRKIQGKWYYAFIADKKFPKVDRVRVDGFVFNYNPRFLDDGRRQSNVEVSVVKRADDYMAYLNGDKRLWDRGKTPAEAVGNVLITMGDTFNIKIHQYEH